MVTAGLHSTAGRRRPRQGEGAREQSRGPFVCVPRPDLGPQFRTLQLPPGGGGAGRPLPGNSAA